MKKALFFLFFSFLGCIPSGARVTTVRGKVTDASDGKPLQYAGIYFKGFSSGVVTDRKGNYSITADTDAPLTLVCRMLGYGVSVCDIAPGTDTTVNFPLRPVAERISGAVVRPDGRRTRALMDSVVARRSLNDPVCRGDHSCRAYSKIVLEVLDSELEFTDKLPMVLSETVSKLYFKSDSGEISEVIEATRISGSDNDGIFSPYTGSQNLHADFYSRFVNLFGLEFPSPAGPGGRLHYNYYLVDSLSAAGRKAYLLRFHPKTRDAAYPVFDGEMYVDCEDYALVGIRASMVRSGTLNWINSLSVENSYARDSLDRWYCCGESVHSVFTTSPDGSSGLVSLSADRVSDYSAPDFRDGFLPGSGNIGAIVAPFAGDAGDDFWEESRPAELTERERRSDEEMSRFETTPLYRGLRTAAYALATGFVDSGPLGFGPVLETASFNNVEGFRGQLGLHTTDALSDRVRLTVYGAYGTRDRLWKGGAKCEFFLRDAPARKLTASVSYDQVQLGRGQSIFTQGNIISSIWGGNRKTSPCSSFVLNYNHAFSGGFSVLAGAGLYRHFENGFVPMRLTDGRLAGSVASNEMRLEGRYSGRNASFNLGLTASVPGLRAGDCGFLRPEAGAKFRLRLPPAGTCNVSIAGGAVIGQVPYPYLHIFEGNVTGIIDRTAFSCMDYFEFASDSWVSVMIDHDFEGLLLGRVPVLKYAGLRENVFVKAAWGRLSEGNDGSSEGCSAKMCFPDGMKSPENPYLEAGFGISNIFRLFRVDATWRLSGLENARRKFMLNFGMEFKF